MEGKKRWVSFAEGNTIQNTTLATKSESDRKDRLKKLNFKPQELNLNYHCLKFKALLKAVNLEFNPQSLKSLGLMVQIILIAGITYFLLREAVEFYRSNNSNLEQSILAAVLVEGLLIVFAFLKPSNMPSQILVKAVLVILFLYSSWSFSSNVIGKGMGNIAQGEVLRESISGLKAAMAKNDLAIEVFIKKAWLSAARKLTTENNDLRRRLLELQSQEMNQSFRPDGAQISNTFSLVVLRFLFQISNIVLVHQLSSGFQKKFRSRRRTQVWRGEMNFAAA